MSEYGARRYDEPFGLPKAGDTVQYHGTLTTYRVQRVNEDGSVALVSVDEPITSHRSTPHLLTLVERAA